MMFEAYPVFRKDVRLLGKFMVTMLALQALVSVTAFLYPNGNTKSFTDIAGIVYRDLYPLHMYVFLSVLSVLAAAYLWAEEKQNGTDWLLRRLAISRRQINTEKLSAAAVILLSSFLIQFLVLLIEPHFIEVDPFWNILPAFLVAVPVSGYLIGLPLSKWLRNTVQVVLLGCGIQCLIVYAIVTPTWIKDRYVDGFLYAAPAVVVIILFYLLQRRDSSMLREKRLSDVIQWGIIFAVILWSGLFLAPATERIGSLVSLGLTGLAVYFGLLFHTPADLRQRRSTSAPGWRLWSQGPPLLVTLGHLLVLALGAHLLISIIHPGTPAATLQFIYLAPSVILLVTVVAHIGVFLRGDRFLQFHIGTVLAATFLLSFALVAAQNNKPLLNYFTLGFLVPPLYLGVSIYSDREIDGVRWSLYHHPLSRSRLFICRTLAALGLLLLFSVAIALSIQIAMDAPTAAAYQIFLLVSCFFVTSALITLAIRQKMYASIAALAVAGLLVALLVYHETLNRNMNPQSGPEVDTYFYVLSTFLGVALLGALRTATDRRFLTSSTLYRLGYISRLILFAAGFALFAASTDLRDFIYLLTGMELR